MSTRALLLAAAIGGLFSALAVVGLLSATDHLGGEDEPAAVGPVVTGAPGSLPRLYRQVARGVVRVDARPPGTPIPRGPPRENDGVATGSGFLIGSGGQIVTNDHVVAGGSVVSVQADAGGTRIAARVVGRDPSTDLALIRIDPAKAPNLKPLALGDSDMVHVGDQAIAIGNPFGLERTLTVGIVSATDREIRSPNGDKIESAIQTDAAINPGSSGGPLLDEHGAVIGVNSQARGSGIGFAVCVNTLKRALPQLRRGGGRSVRQAYLGVELAGPGRVANLVRGGPGDRAGLRDGDTIVAVDGRGTSSADAVVSAVRRHKPGDTVQLRVRRGGRTLTLSVKLGARP